MKEIVYLDTSFLHSFMAQIYGGLPSNKSSETQESRTETSVENRTIDKGLESSLGFNFVVAKGGFVKKPKESSLKSFSLSQLDLGKEIISRQLHDNALDDLTEYLRSENLLIENGDTPVVGKYVLTKSTFKIIDLGFFKSILKKEYHGLLGFTKPTSKHRKPHQEKPAENSLDPNEMINIFDFLTEILPSDLFINQNGLLAPLKKDYLREQTKELIFKYGEESEICMLGKITKDSELYEDDSEVVDSSILFLNSVIHTASEKFIVDFGIKQIGDKIVSPIAIFFESI